MCINPLAELSLSRVAILDNNFNMMHICNLEDDFSITIITHKAQVDSKFIFFPITVVICFDSFGVC